MNNNTMINNLPIELQGVLNIAENMNKQELYDLCNHINSATMTKNTFRKELVQVAASMGAVESAVLHRVLNKLGNGQAQQPA